MVPSLAWRPASGETSDNVTETSEASSSSEDDSPTLRERSQSSLSCCAWVFAVVLPFLRAKDNLVALCPSSGPSVVPVMVESESGDAVLRLGLVGEFGRPYRDGECLVLC